MWCGAAWTRILVARQNVSRRRAASSALREGTPGRRRPHESARRRRSRRQFVRCPRKLGQDHPLLGAGLDLSDEAGDSAVQLLLLVLRFAVPGAVRLGLVHGQRQEEVALLPVPGQHRVERVRLRSGTVDQRVPDAEALALVAGDRVSEAQAALADAVGVDPLRPSAVFSRHSTRTRRSASTARTIPR